MGRAESMAQKKALFSLSGMDTGARPQKRKDAAHKMTGVRTRHTARKEKKKMMGPARRNKETDDTGASRPCNVFGRLCTHRRMNSTAKKATRERKRRWRRIRTRKSIFLGRTARRSIMLRARTVVLRRRPAEVGLHRRGA
ncbi:hypothetical protein MRX96_002456 [Rhipicephalus microplus]